MSPRVAAAGGVVLVADDLTGALDTAAPFASAAAPVAVLPSDHAEETAPRGSVAIDAGSRGRSEAEAAAGAARVAALMRHGRIAFRKIDSLLRGHPGAEIAATARAGAFASVVIAPAFPAQGRITLQGRQYARAGDGTWRLIERDLFAELATRGLGVRAGKAGAIAGAGVYFCDAEYESDLVAIAAARPRLKGPVLWCGSSGLARALAGGAPRPTPLPDGPILGLVGTRHPVSQAEIDALRRASAASVVAVGGEAAIAAAVDRAGQGLARGRSVLLALALSPREVSESPRVLASLARAVARLSPAGVYASGGDTLAALVAALGAERLDVVGEHVPGVPVSRFVGGAWDAVPVVSKSGAFAGAQVLKQFFTTTKEKAFALA